ncbi:MAG TPA: transcriptional regulator [Terriglobales bacterium]
MSRKTFVLLTVVLLCGAAWAGQWTALGPDGGDVRSLSYDPKNPDHIFLGTSTGSIFKSLDGGHTWEHFAHLGAGDDYVIDHLQFDPKDSSSMYAAAWSVNNQQEGDLFFTHDSGMSWQSAAALRGKSVRAMVISASDSKVITVGALDGVYRTVDGGLNWKKISSGDEIHSVESIAVDPQNPNTIYAGTWHLAWKTTDGGANWSHITKGMIEDSDVFSIIVDPSNTQTIFASACSGIYKSVNAGEQFSKIQGIPFSARRTRVLMQDPNHAEIVYAGTTEGLWKTADAGKTWKRVSNPEVVVNDVMIDPRNSQRVLLATDRSGILASDDGAQSFLTSNKGYAHRYVSSVVTSNANLDTIYVGVVNDREAGGVFVSQDQGKHWTQKSVGLDGRDVFALKETPNGDLVAATNRGMFMLAKNASVWSPINTVVEDKASSRIITTKSGQKKSVPSTTQVKSVLTAHVSDIEIAPTRWLAATSSGIYMSADQGKTWKGGPVMGQSEFVGVRANDNMIAAATRETVLISNDNAATWHVSTGLASTVKSIRNLAMTPDGQLVIASREGAFRSQNGGVWEHIVNGLPEHNISSVSYDAKRNQWFATSTETGVVFVSTDGHSWERGPDAGYPLRGVSFVHGRFVGATSFDGVVLQPENDNQSAAATVGASNN